VGVCGRGGEWAAGYAHSLASAAALPARIMQWYSYIAYIYIYIYIDILNGSDALVKQHSSWRPK